jgi:hypothetical protein
MVMSITNPEALQGLVSSLVNDRTIHPWHAPLPFNVSNITYDETASVVDIKQQWSDILSPPPAAFPWNTCRISFCPKTYKPDGCFSSDSGFSLLKKDLGNAALQSGFRIQSTGATKKARITDGSDVAAGRNTRAVSSSNKKNIEKVLSSMINEPIVGKMEKLWPAEPPPCVHCPMTIVVVSI